MRLYPHHDLLGGTSVFRITFQRMWSADQTQQRFRKVLFSFIIIIISIITLIQPQDNTGAHTHH